MSPTDRDCRIIEESMRLWALGTEPAKPTREWQNTRVQVDSRELTVFSYGRHFPLATVYPRGRRGGLILLNGDTAGSQGWRRTRTNDHQAAVQQTAQAIAQESNGAWQVVILPITALDGAGIDSATIRPLDIAPDTRDTFRHTAILPSGTFGALPTRGLVDNPQAYDWRRERNTDQPLTMPAPDAIERQRVTLVIESSGNGLERAGIPTTATREAIVTRKTVWSSGHYGRDGYQVTEHNPPRCEYAISGAIGASSNAAYPTTVSASLAAGSQAGAGAAVALDWSSSRHWLGEALFTADRVSESSMACHTANPAALDNDWCETCGGSLRRDGIERRTIRRRYRWLSSFDYNERAPLYFLAALPTRSRARSVAMAIEDLAPRAVHAALARGLAVERQGDVFLIPTKLTDNELANRGARFARLTMHTRGAKPRVGEIGYAKPLDAAGRRRMAQWRRKRYRELMAQAPTNAAPVTARGARREYANLRAAQVAKLATLDAAMRSAIMGADNGRRSYAYQSSGANGLTVAQRRRENLRAVQSARSALDYARRHGGTDNRGRSTVAHCRDWYRMHNAKRALELWAQAGNQAALRFAPAAVVGSARWHANREATREALAIYGTAHTATAVAVCASGTYARGMVRHVPDIANERRDADHQPLALAPDTWYLAVRNTVPRMVGTAATLRRRW